MTLNLGFTYTLLKKKLKEQYEHTSDLNRKKIMLDINNDMDGVIRECHIV